MLQELQDELTTHWAWTLGQYIVHDAFAEPDERHNVAAQTGTIVTVLTVALVAIIGILIFEEVETSIGNFNDSGLSNTSSNVTSGFGDAISLVPIVLLVLVASLVIAVVQQF